ncbi:MAG: hypothetical protein WD625_01955 [Balneolales bacterium]
MIYLIALAAILLAFLVGEILLRCTGYQPWNISDEKIKLGPKNDLFSPDPELGLKHNSGTFNVSLPGTGAFTTTHDHDAFRITGPVNGQAHNGIQKKKDEIWVFGCSVTYGWSLNDDETYPWLMQKKLPDFQVLNFGVNGFSTIQSLIQFRKALQKRRKPKYIIVAYTHLHDKRNTLVRSWRKIIESHQKAEAGIGPGATAFPCGKIDCEGNLVYERRPIGYKAFPLMRHSALMHCLEGMFNRMQEWSFNSHLVSRSVMEEFMKTCEQNGLKLIVAGLDDSVDTKNMLIYCKREGISSVVMPIDLQGHEHHDHRDVMLSNAVRNQKYAERLVRFIKSYEQKILKKRNKRSRAISTRIGPKSTSIYRKLGS